MYAIRLSSKSINPMLSNELSLCVHSNPQLKIESYFLCYASCSDIFYDTAISALFRVTLETVLIGPGTDKMIRYFQVILFN